MSILSCLKGAALALTLVTALATAAQAASYPEPYPALLAEAKEMETLTVIMPVRIFNLANRFAECPDKEATAGIVDTILTRSENKFVRRVGFTALRFMARPAFTSIDAPALTFRGMDDANDWVRYDAVWAGDAMGLDTPQFRAKLKELAQGLDPSEYSQIASSDAKKQLQRRSGLLLQKLTDKVAK